MIDLRRPLEGTPGLLLMAALVLFGVTVGVACALAFSWVEMKDFVANFLGASRELANVSSALRACG